MLTTEELKKLNVAELDKELVETEEEYLKLQLQIESRQSHVTSHLNDLRKQRARIKTFKRQARTE